MKKTSNVGKKLASRSKWKGYRERSNPAATMVIMPLVPIFL